MQLCLTGYLPDCIHDWYRIRLHLKHRAILRGTTHQVQANDANSLEK
jgi:17beta-estradiol 17-dehydrogenase / very-long-chain 3-oxoacyl-CoA reductase